MNLPAAAMPGLDQLIQRLRQAPLQVRVGTSEAIDAARLLAHLAAQPGVDDPTLETLRLRLRPVLCKAAGDLDHFNAAFDAWAQEVQAARGAPDVLPPPTGIEGTRGTGHTDRSVKPVDPAPPRPGVAPTKAGATTPPATPAWRQPWFWALLSVLLLAAAVVAMRWPPAETPQPATTPAPGPMPAAASASTPGPAPSAPRLTQALGPVPDTGPTVRGFTPDWHASETLRWPWLLLLLALPLLGLLPLLGAPPPLPYIRRQRGAGSLTLEAWPPHKQRRQLVREIAPATSGQLQRHVRGAVDQREAYARRPRLDLRRTVNASLARGGLLQLHYRFARLRPAYLVLVHAPQDDDLGVLWARRLAELDVRAAIFRFQQAEGEAQPQCVEVGGLGRRLPFSALPAPWPEQRLVIIARCGVLVGRDGQLRPWVQQARLGRWAHRVLFSPDEPRDWPRRQVQALEAGGEGGLGMQVLPFEDNALDAWSDWLVRGEMPAITLEAPQLYPRLLKENEARFCGDTQPAELASDPAQAEKLAQQIVTQLQAYLGQNGFYWLCACAVPPLLEQRLAQLLGEEYFRRCGASEPRVAAYMARNWRLLVRLPWLRPQAQQMPQWLRLALLARLAPAIQDELREVVRGALGRRAAAVRPGEGLALAFDAPDAAPLPGAGRVDDARHALLVGFVQEGLDAHALMLRLPGAWQQWLPALRQGRGRGRGWTAVAHGWRRLQRADAGTRAAARRWAVAGVLLGASALAALPTVPAAQWPGALRALLFVKQAQSVAVDSSGEVLALDASGRRVVVADIGGASLRDIVSERALTPLDGTPTLIRAEFSVDGNRLVTVQGDGQIKVYDSASLRVISSQHRVLADLPSLTEVVPNANGSRLLLMAADVDDQGQALGSDKLTVRDALTGQRLSTVQPPTEFKPLAFTWGAGDKEFTVILRSGPENLVRAVGTEGNGNWVTADLPAGMVDLVDLSPDGRRWLVRDAAGRLLLGSLQNGRPDDGVVVVDKPVKGVHFSADGRRLLVKRADGVVQVLRTTDRPGPVTELPTDLPADTAWRDGSFAEAWGGWQVPIVPLAAVVLLLALLAATGISLRGARRAGARLRAVA